MIVRGAVNHPVSVHLLMLFIIIVGALEGLGLRQELFPTMNVNEIVILVPYPGAAPEEIERAMVRKIEEKIQGTSGVHEIRAIVGENLAWLVVETRSGEDVVTIADEIRRDIETITDFPAESEKVVVFAAEADFPVITLVVRGTADERQLRDTAQAIKEELLYSGGRRLDAAGDESIGEHALDFFRAPVAIARVTITGVRAPEYKIEFRPEKLAAHSLSPRDVADAVSRANRDFPGGAVDLREQTLWIRTVGERPRIADLQNIPVRAASGGDFVTLGDVADIRADFKDKMFGAMYQGERAAALTVFKEKKDDAVLIAERVRDYVAWKNASATLPAGVHLTTTADMSVFIRQRVELLSRNALTGLALVLVTLVFFLNLRVAFWVAAGLPVAMLGTLVVMKLFGQSINMITLFGLIIAVGLLVDDAIVIGENIWRRVEKGEEPRLAAVRGTREVTMPVMAAVTTTVAAFIPLAFIEGVMGDFLGVLPVVVGSALAVSTLEAFIILPVHLAHSLKPRQAARRLRGAAGEFIAGVSARWERFSIWKANVLQKKLTGMYMNVLNRALRHRYFTQALIVAAAIAAAGLVAGGIVPFVFLQSMDSDRVTISLEMSAGTPGERTLEALTHIDAVVRDRTRFPDVRSSYAMWGGKLMAETGAPIDAGEEEAQLILELEPSEERRRNSKGRDAAEIVNALRREIGEVRGANKLVILPESGGPEGADIELRIIGDDQADLVRGVAIAREELVKFVGVHDIEDTLALGKQEIQLRLLPTAAALGFTERDVAAQIRGAFYGIEVQSLRRRRDEVEVYTRLLPGARASFSDVERLTLRAPDGASVPLTEVVELIPGRGYGALRRVNLRRYAMVRAFVDQKAANTEDVQRDFERVFGKRLTSEVPRASYRFTGRKRQLTESMSSLAIGFPLAMLGIFSILAILFRSFTQPFVVMAAIPFGFIGATIGHWLLGFPFTLLSMIGLVALSGIVVNDSSILVDFINTRVRQGWKVHDAILDAGATRLRPILLTSVTTMAGLAPLMMEQSFQAQFLIPMAISIVFGIGFATVLTLIMVPCAYASLIDVTAFVTWMRRGRWEYRPKTTHHISAQEAELPDAERHL